MTPPSSTPRRPLVALTRRPEDNAPLGALLEARGLRWISAPCVALAETRPSDADLAAIRAEGPVAGVAFPSRNAVAALLDHPDLVAALDLRPERLVVAAVGPATSEALRARGWPVAVEPDTKTGAALAEALVRALPAGARVLLPGGDRARPELPEGLRRSGLVPVPLQVYAHAVEFAPPSLPERPDVVVCASPSAAETFLTSHPGLGDLCFVAIGPTTRAALEGLGAARVTQARSPSPEALADAAWEALEQAGPQTPPDPKGGTP